MERSFNLTHGEMVIPCKVFEPDFGPVQRCIVGVHGFGGNKDSQILADIAEEMGLFGAATVRFDLPAHGENPLPDRALTLPNCLYTLMAVASWAREQYPQADLCIFATGFGAYVTLLALEDMEFQLGRIRLVLQTPNVRMADSLLAMTGLTEEAFEARGRVALDTARSFEVPYSFYQELKANQAYTSYSTPMLLLHGELDTVVSYEDILNFRRINEQAKLVIIPGAEHRFLRAGAWDMVVDLTRDWFEHEQVLLCDWS